MEKLIKLKDNHHNKNRNIHSNDDAKINRSEEINTRTTQSIETMETEIRSTEPLSIAVNESNIRSCKSNQLYTGDMSSSFSDTDTSKNKGYTNRKKYTHYKRFSCKKYRDVETQQ